MARYRTARVQREEGRAHAHGFRTLRTAVAGTVAEVRLIAVADTNVSLAQDLAGRQRSIRNASPIAAEQGRRVTIAEVAARVAAG